MKYDMHSGPCSLNVAENTLWRSSLKVSRLLIGTIGLEDRVIVCVAGFGMSVAGRGKSILSYALISGLW